MQILRFTIQPTMEIAFPAQAPIIMMINKLLKKGKQNRSQPCDHDVKMQPVVLLLPERFVKMIDTSK